MYRLRLFKILFIHSPKLLSRFFLLMFRKNSKPEFEYTIKTKEHKNLKLLKNQLTLELVVKNGFVLRIGKQYIPLFREYTQVTLNVPMTGQDGQIQLKVFGFFKSIKVVIPIERSSTSAIRPVLSKEKLMFHVNVKLVEGQNHLINGLFLPQIQIATLNSEPLLINSSEFHEYNLKLKTISKPILDHDIEKLELKLNQNI